MSDPVRGGAAATGWQMRIWPRRDAGPLAVVMTELIDWLVAEGYAPTTQRNLVRAAARLGSWLAAEGVALEDVDAHEVGHRRRAVDLALEVLAPRVPVAVLVLAALVGAHVGEHLVLGERELGDHVVEHGNRRQLAF